MTKNVKIFSVYGVIILKDFERFEYSISPKVLIENCTELKIKFYSLRIIF